MPKVVREILGAGPEGWSGGVVSAIEATLLPANASPRGLNSALALASRGVAYVQKRLGLELLTATPMSGSPVLIGGYQYNKSDGTQIVLVMSDTGRLEKYASSAFTNISTGFTSGTYYPDFETANDLCFIVNGQDRKKYNGTSVTNFGIARPTVGTLAGAAGAAGGPNGTYELRVSYGNSSTGAESSASNTATATVTVANQKISVTNVPVSSDGQVDRRFLYVRETSLQAQFYLAGTISDNSATTITLDFTNATLLTPAPTTTSNNEPPTGAKYLALHQGRMFVATDTGLYYSAINKPEAFDPLNFEAVNQNDGEKFMGIHSDHEVLIILKERSTYALYGTDPDTWQIRLIDGDIGCVSHRTLLSSQGYVWWWSNTGVARWNLSDAIDRVGLRLYGNPEDTLNVAEMLRASAADHAPHARILFAVPGIGQSRATLIVPFNVATNAFEATYWDPMDAAVLFPYIASTGPEVMLGGYAGQVFRCWANNNDGVPSGTLTGTFTASGVSTSGITDSGASFLNTGGKLIERRVTILDSDGIPNSIRPRITTNDATSLTFDTAVTTTPGLVYTYIIGGPNFQWDTGWRAFQDLMWGKKRFEYFYTLLKGSSFDTTVRGQMFFDYNDVGPKDRLFTASSGGGALWDGGIWDQSVWDSQGEVMNRFRIGRAGTAYKARIINAAVNDPFAILQLATQIFLVKD